MKAESYGIVSGSVFRVTTMAGIEQGLLKAEEER